MGPREPPAYPQWGSEVERRDAARGALFGRRPVAGSECAVQHLPGSTAGQGVQERGSRRGSPSATSRLRCCRRQSGCNSGPPGQDVANRLRLLLYSRELLGEVLDRVAKEAGLGHGGIK